MFLYGCDVITILIHVARILHVAALAGVLRRRAGWRLIGELGTPANGGTTPTQTTILAVAGVASTLRSVSIRRARQERHAR